jgi:hypothetical protein
MRLLSFLAVSLLLSAAAELAPAGDRRPVPPPPPAVAAAQPEGENAAPKQIMVNIKLVEIEKGKLDRLGFDFSHVLRGGQVSTEAARGPLLMTALDDKYVSGVLDTLREENLARVLARPTLVTTSGRRATFRTGGEIECWERDKSGKLVPINKPYGTAIDFLPVLTESGNIRLSLRHSYSEPDWSHAVTVAPGKTTPGFHTTELEFAAELKPGHTLAVLPSSPGPEPGDATAKPAKAMLLMVTADLIQPADSPTAEDRKQASTSYYTATASAGQN